MEIRLMDGSTVRPPQQVKAMQILREQKLGLEQSRRVAQETDTVALKEERRAKELEQGLLAARSTLAASLRRFDGGSEASSLSPAAAPPGEQKALRGLAAAAAFAEDECFAQQQRAARERAANLAAVRSVEARERLGVKNAEVAAAYAQRAGDDAGARQQRASRVNRQELAAAAALEHKHAQRVDAYAAAVAATQQQRSQQEATARVLHAGAVRRMMATTATTVDALALLKQKRAADHAHKVESVLSLKANTDAAFSKIKAANARAARRAAALAAAQANEFAALTAKGENPYKVFRAREVAAAAALAERDAHAAVARKEAALVRRLVKSDEDGQQRDAAEAHARAHEREFRDASGKSVTEARNKAYLVSRTTAGVDMVDPSGRAVRSFEPSQVTTLKDHSFGLGYNPRKDAALYADVVKLVAAKAQHAGISLGEFQRLVPKPPALPSSSQGGSGGGGEQGAAGGEPGGAAGGELARLSEFVAPFPLAVTPALLGLASAAGSLALAAPGSDSAIGGAAGSSSARVGGALPRNLLEGTKGLSQFELECRAKAQARQRQALLLGAPQTVSGYTFKGAAAFEPKPARVEFLDFEPGQVYTRGFSLTNTSLTFNSFKLLALPDAVRDFFEVAYVKPGRMSAGTACSVEITFRPSVNADIATSLPLLTETGPCEVPVVCCTRKVVPSVASDHVAFGAVPTGELKTMHLVVRNGGALPTTYELFDLDTGLLAGDHALPMGASSKPSLASPSLASLPASPLNTSLGAPGSENDLAWGADDGDDNALGAPQGVTVLELGGGQDAAAPLPPYRSAEATAAAQAQAAQATAEAALLAACSAVGAAALAYPPGSAGALQFASRGAVKPYSEAHHAIHFGPLAPGYFLRRLALRFTGTAHVIEVEISGTAELCFVFAKEPVLDLQTVVHGKLFRKALVLSNRGKIAFKVEAHVPPELVDFLEFSPNSGFVQPGVDFELGLKLRPAPSLLEACAAVAVATGGRHSVTAVGHFCDLEHGVVCVPLRVLVPKQALPVFFTLRCQVTAGTLTLDPPQGLAFGPCYVTERRVQRLLLTNDSCLPQKFGFVRVPPCFAVQPADGFGVLLPHETRAVDVAFQPTDVGPALSSAATAAANATPLALTLRTSLGATYAVPCAGAGVAPPLELSATVLQLAPCAVGDWVTASCTVGNPSRTRAMVFHFVVPFPHLSRLHVSPAVATLQPGQKVRVEVRFSAQPPPTTRPEVDASVAAKRAARLPAPAAADNGAAPDPAADAAADAAGAADAADAAEALAEAEALEVSAACVEDLAEHVGRVTRSVAGSSEPWSVHATFHLPCYAKVLPRGGDADGANAKAAEAGTPEAEGDFSAAGGDDDPLPQFLTVSSTVVARVLEGDASSLDFGELAVGQAKTLTLRLTNHGAAGVALAATGLSSVGPFSVRNALREVGGGGHASVQVQFEPTAQGVRQEELQLHDLNLGLRLRVPLKGKGVSPRLEVEDPAGGVVDCGHCVEGDACEQTVTLRNASHFALTFQLAPLDAPAPNFNNRPPFTLAPPEATVPPGEAMHVRVTFAPDHARAWPFHQTLRVAVPSQEVEPRLHLSGRSHARQLFVVAADATGDAANQLPEQREDPLLLPPRALHSLLGDSSSSSTRALFGERPPEAPCIKLTFPWDAPKNGSSSSSSPAADDDGDPTPAAAPTGQAVVVGCCVLTRFLSSSSGGSYEVEFDAANQYFACSAPKGSVAPGELKTVPFTFAPPAVAETYGLDVGQWARTTAKVTLTGGFCHPHADHAPVLVLLEGYIQI